MYDEVDEAEAIDFCGDEADQIIAKSLPTAFDDWLPLANDRSARLLKLAQLHADISKALLSAYQEGYASGVEDAPLHDPEYVKELTDDDNHPREG
jgi:hypothetical protein